MRFVVSGSASTPIFRKSRESLLGRIKDFHVLPFSYREWFYIGQTWRGSAAVMDGGAGVSSWLFQTGRQLAGRSTVDLISGLTDLCTGEGLFPDAVESFLFEGGFPEVWNLPSLLAKQEYLYQNQVERVIFEDLLVAAEFRLSLIHI